MLKEITLKEFFYYLYSPIGFIFGLLLLSVSTGLFFNDFFLSGQASMAGLFLGLFYLLTLFIPAITMSSLADEQKNGTWEILLTSSLSETKLVIGKFLGLLLVTILYIMMTLPLVAIVGYLGQPDYGLILSGYIGIILLAAVYIAIGIFTSSFTSSAMVAFLFSTVMIMLLGIFSQNSFISRLPRTVSPVLEALSLGKYLDEFVSGVIRLPSVTVLLTVTIIFLSLSVASLKSRNA